VSRHRLATAVLLLLAPAILLAACSDPSPNTTPTDVPGATAVPATPAPSATTAPSDTPIPDPTCETIIPEGTVDDYAEVGWTPKSEAFRIGGREIPDGVLCTWGDYSVATDLVQVYGWAPLDEAEADDAIEELVASGWRREDDGAGVYVTESEDTVINPDPEGYGFTYYFGDGWVKFADTKQTIVLVEWPPR
jgi:hypothetical protein